VIGIDEAQFFCDLKQYVIKWCEEYNKNITVIGLDGDFKRNVFGHILDLIPVCDNFYKLKAFFIIFLSFISTDNLSLSSTYAISFETLNP
jgi:hypothetical protein